MDIRIDITIDTLLNPIERYNISKDGCEIGNFLRGNDEEYVGMFMDFWTGRFSDFPEQYKTIEYYITRLFTYNEFINWHNGEPQTLLDRLSTRILGLRGKFDKSHRGYCQCILYISQNTNPKVAEFFYKPLSAKIPKDNRKRHTYIIGSTGGGKSQMIKTMAYDSINEIDSATVIIDPKGDLAREIAQFREFSPKGKYYDRLVYIKPTLFDDVVPKINIFDQFKDMRTSADEIVNMVASIFREANTTSEFTGAMEMMITSLVSFCFEFKLDFVQMYRMVDTSETKKSQGKEVVDREKIKAKIQDLLDLTENISNSFDRHYFKEKFGSALMSTKQGIEWRIASLIQNTLFQQITTGESSINLNDLIEQKKIIVIDLSKGDLGTRLSSVLGKLIVSTIQVVAQSRAKLDRKDRTTTWLYIDEFQNYITSSIETAITELRSAGLHLTIAQQLTGQKMDTEYSRVIMANTDVKIMAKSTVENWKAMEEQMGLTRKQLMDLPQYNYWAKVGSGKPMLIDYTSKKLLDDNNSMTKEEWQQVIERQRELYYREPLPLLIPNPDIIEIAANNSLPLPLD